MAAHQVKIQQGPQGQGFVYSPADLKVKKGDTVAWVNSTTIDHTATSDDDGASFDTGVIVKNSTSDPQTINNAPGPVPYHCEIHPKTMKARLTVVS